MLRMPIATIYFELHATLIDSAQFYPCAAVQLGQSLEGRYGGEARQWTAAYQRIRADWDSYHADLDFGGEDGLDHVYEGLYRTTRALFRLTKTPEPPRDELQRLSRELPALMTLDCDAIRPQDRVVIATLAESSYRLGITTHVLENQARALLNGGKIAQCFKAPVLGVDSIGQYVRDEMYYRRVSVRSRTAPEQCLIVDRSYASLEAAKSAGMQTAWLVDQPPSASPTFVDIVLPGMLESLLPLLKVVSGASTTEVRYSSP
jgi:FMN phosphatase YigB (HAD superfamily)